MPNLYDLNHVAQARRKLERGEPCSHPGCLSHVSHPCEGCGRVGGTITLEEALAIEVENKRLAEENARLKADLADATDCIDLFNRTIVHAERKWKEVHPDSAFYPDVPDLLAWVKEQVDKLAERRCETCAHYDERGWCEVNARTYPSSGFCSEWEAADA